MDLCEFSMEGQSTNTGERNSNGTLRNRTTTSFRNMKNFFKSRKAWKEPSPEEVSVDNAYKTRWIWYHTILALELLMVNILLVAILIVLALKL